METSVLAKKSSERILPILDEAQALLAQADGLKPGVQTTEFWLMAGTSLVITGLAAFGRIEPAVAGILLSANSAIYQTLRQGMKKSADAAPVSATQPVVFVQSPTPANAAQVVAPASLAQSPASANSLPLASAVSGEPAQAAAGKQD